MNGDDDTYDPLTGATAPAGRSCSPDVLATYAERIRSLRMDALCDIDSDYGILSAEHVLLALDMLGAAERHMRLGLYYRRRND